MEAAKQLMGLHYKVFKSQVHFLHDIHSKSLSSASTKRRQDEQAVEIFLPSVPHDSIETQLLALVTEGGSLRSASAAEALYGLISTSSMSIMHKSVVLEVLSRTCSSRTSSSLLAPFVLRGGLSAVMKWGRSDSELLPALLHWLYLVVHNSVVGHKSQRSIREWLKDVEGGAGGSAKILAKALNNSLGADTSSAAPSLEKKRPFSAIESSGGKVDSGTVIKKHVVPPSSLTSLHKKAVTPKPAAPTLAKPAAPTLTKPVAVKPVGESTDTKNVLDRYLDTIDTAAKPVAQSATTKSGTKPMPAPAAASSRASVPPANIVALGRNASQQSAPPSNTNMHSTEDEFSSFAESSSTSNRSIKWADEMEGGVLVMVREFASDPEERSDAHLLPSDESTDIVITSEDAHNYAALRKKEHEGERIGFLRSQQRLEEERLQAAMRIAEHMKPQIEWQSPALVYRKNNDAANTDSKERRLQLQRVSRREEIIYGSAAEIPPNPENPTELNPIVDMRNVGGTNIIAIPFVNEDDDLNSNDVSLMNEEKEEEGANLLELLPPYIMYLAPEHLAVLVDTLSNEANMHLMMDPSQPAFVDLVERIAPGTKRRFNL